MLLYANTSVFMWKSSVFWFCTVWCLQTLCEMRHLYTLRCPAPFWLIQCKPYRNGFIIAKVIDISLGARFLWPTVYISILFVSEIQQMTLWNIQQSFNSFSITKIINCIFNWYSRCSEKLLHFPRRSNRSAMFPTCNCRSISSEISVVW